MKHLKKFNESSFSDVKKDYPWKDTEFGKIEDLFDEISDLFNNFLDDIDITIYPWLDRSSEVYSHGPNGLYYNIKIGPESLWCSTDLFIIDFLSVASDKKLIKCVAELKRLEFIPRLESICSQWGYKVKTRQDIRNMGRYQIRVVSDLGDIAKKLKS